ncbi:MAG: VWA domain-containing protein, partial [Candidatus Acidiferrales bacterium]
PKIRVETHLVEVGVIVRDKNGPVENLTKDGFVVRDQGKPQKISLFSVESAKSAAPPAQPLPQNTFSDLPQYGATTPNSITIVLLDNLNTLYGSGSFPYETKPYWIEDLALANAKVHLTEFIQQLKPQDRVAIYGLSDSLHVLCDFTSDREQLLAIVKNYNTASKTSRAAVAPGAFHSPVPGLFNPDVDADSLRLAATVDERRAEKTMAALESIVAHVANIPGRKNLVWLTANLPFSGAALARILVPAQIAAYPVDGRALLTKTPLEDMDGVADEDRAAKGDFMPAQSPQPIGISTMQKLAEETGGQAFVNTNDLTGAIRKAVEDSAVTYTLGFYVNTDSLDGKFHEVKVEVNRKGLTLRYPRGYFALRDAPATKDQNQIRVMTAIQSPIESSSIPVQVNVGRLDRTPPSSYGFSGSIDVHHLRLAQNGGFRTGAIDVFTIEQDAAGKV